MPLARNVNLKTMERIDVVSFDAAGTILRPHPSVGEVYADALARHGIEADPEAIEQSFHGVLKRAMAQPRSHLSAQTEQRFWFEVVQATLMPFVALAPPREEVLSEIFTELWLAFASGAHWRLFEDVLPTMQTLREAGLRMIVFSNADARMRTVLDELGVLPQLEGVFLSAEIGCEKPLAEAFRAVQEALQLPPERILHVGDRPDADVAGARQAGWQALRIEHGGTPDDTMITRIGEIPGRLGI